MCCLCITDPVAVEYGLGGRVVVGWGVLERTKCHPPRQREWGWGSFLRGNSCAARPHTELVGHPVVGRFVYFYPLGKIVQCELFIRPLICHVSAFGRLVSVCGGRSLCTEEFDAS